MGLIDIIADDILAPGLVKLLGVELPVASEILTCVDLEKLGRILRKHGQTEIAGVDLQKFLEAVEAGAKED